jgi:hypothetical protein
MGGGGGGRSDAPRAETKLVKNSASRGSFYIGAMSLVVLYSIWFGYIAPLSQWGGRDLLLAQIVSTCLRGVFLKVQIRPTIVYPL